jgi:HTH-type transcriptional regulator/antitoxin HigA
VEVAFRTKKLERHYRAVQRDYRSYSDLAIPPGEYLAEVLKAKGMAQADLARRIGRPVQAVNEIIKGEKAITPETALQLERALAVPAHIWTGLESRYQLIKARLKEKKQLKQESTVASRIPYKQLAELKCVDQTRDPEHKVRELHRFYGVSSLANVPETKAYQASFRCGRGREASGYALAAWIRCAELRAAEIRTDAFDKKKLRSALSEIRSLSLTPPEVFEPRITEILAKCGVAFVLLPHFPKTYANGATFWVKTDKAVLLMSIRGKWEDIFWFSLFHELGHLLLHGKRTFIDDRKVRPELAGKEREADEFAANLLIPKEEFLEFASRGDFSESAIRAFAEVYKISPAIVVDRLQHEKLLAYDSELNRLRRKYVWKN